MATPGSNNAESGGATTTSGGRTSTGTGFGPERSVNPKDPTAGETFASGERPVLERDIDQQGDVLTSSYYEHSNAGNSADRGGPADIPAPAVVNRGYRNTTAPVPSTTRKGTQRQSY